MSKVLNKLNLDQWDEVAEKHQNYLRLFKMIMEYPTCFMCSFKNPKDALDLDFHLKSTHGFTLDEIIREKLEINGK